MSSFSKDVGEKGRGEGQRLETSGRVLASQQIHGRDTHRADNRTALTGLPLPGEQLSLALGKTTLPLFSYPENRLSFISPPVRSKSKPEACKGRLSDRNLSSRLGQHRISSYSLSLSSPFREILSSSWKAKNWRFFSSYLTFQFRE